MMNVICCWEEYNKFLGGLSKLDYKERIKKLKETADCNESKEDISNTVRDAIRAHAALCAGYYCLRLFLSGEQSYKDDIKNCLEFSSKKGNAYANYMLGQLYFLGWISERDLGKSIDYLEEAVSQNFEASFASLICVYGEKLKEGNLSQEERDIINNRVATIFNSWDDIDRGHRLSKENK